MHPHANSEWWYVVGHLETAGHRRFGFETTLFKLNHLHLPGSKQVLAVDRLDTALTDMKNRSYIHSVRYVEPGLAPVHLSTTSFNERLSTAHLWSVGRVMRLVSSSSGMQLRLDMTTHRRAMLEGGNGLVPMGSRGSSYYYSLTQLSVTGKVLTRGRWMAVTGLAWLDHQWGSWSWSQIRGWTWAALQLRNGVDLSAADFQASGRALHGVTISYPNNQQRTLHRVSITPLGRWRSPDDRAVYGSGWRITIPALKASFTVEPLLKNQEMYDPTEPRTSYWEGDCSVTGTLRAKRISGQAYMELVGVAGRFGSA